MSPENKRVSGKEEECQSKCLSMSVGEEKWRRLEKEPQLEPTHSLHQESARNSHDLNVCGRVQVRWIGRANLVIEVSSINEHVVKCLMMWDVRLFLMSMKKSNYKKNMCLMCFFVCIFIHAQRKDWKKSLVLTRQQTR